jgi:hypothetical protein
MKGRSGKNWGYPDRAGNQAFELLDKYQEAIVPG